MLSNKQALSAQQVQFGLWLGLGARLFSRNCAGAGFDWLLIDAEHGPNDLRSILAQFTTIAPYASHPVVRPPGDHVLIKQLLETGVQTLLIPKRWKPQNKHSIWWKPCVIRRTGFGAWAVR